MSALVVVPFVLPTVVVALAFLALLPDGVERGWAPILVAHAFFNVAVVVRIVGAFWAHLDPRCRRGGGDARRRAAWPVPRDHGCPCSRRRSPRPRRSCSSSPSRRSASSSSSAARARDDRGRDLQPGRAALRPARRGGALARPARASSRRSWVATRLERRVTSPGPLRAERDTLQASSDTQGQARRRREPRRLSGSSSECRWRCSSSARSRSAAGTGSTPTGRSAGRRASLLAAPWEAVVNSLVYAAAATLIALVVGGLAAFAVGWPEGHARGRSQRVHAKGHAPVGSRLAATAARARCCRSACPPSCSASAS